MGRCVLSFVIVIVKGEGGVVFVYFDSLEYLSLPLLDSLAIKNRHLRCLHLVNPTNPS